MPQEAIPESSALQARLAQLAQSRSQSEIARKTGTSVSNVNRYLKGTRMPAEFCAALVKGLGVNPAWLLAGEGTPFVSDITAATASMGSNLLELVEAMNAVSKMRLGALAGKHHLKVLRELNDALATYERLRVKLNEHSVPIFRQLLDDLRKALDRFQTDHAREILRAAQQVARLCDDDALSRELLVLQSQSSFFDSDHAKALQFQRQLMLRPVAAGAILGEESCQTAIRLVLSLHSMHLIEEAARVCDAALCLIPPEGKSWAGQPMLAFLQGRLKAERGELIEGLAIMTRELPRLDGRKQAALRLWITAHMLRAGLLRPQDAFEFGEQMGPKAMLILDFAHWLEDAEFLKRACAYALEEKNERMGELVRPALYGPLLLRALVNHDKKAPAEYERIAPKCDEDYREFPEIFSAQLWRVLGQKPAAQKAFSAAQAKLDGLPRERHVDLITRAVHHRNALWLGGETAVAAKAFFAEHLARGFLCFRGV